MEWSSQRLERIDRLTAFEQRGEKSLNAEAIAIKFLQGPLKLQAFEI
jgi:hypothetical protein